MFIALKTKIWLTVLAIVLLYTFFTLFYFPAKQGESLLKNYNNEIQNLAKTVALGVKIALNEQNYEGVQTAMEFVKESPGLKFVSLIQLDTIRQDDSTKFEIVETILITYPESVRPDSGLVSSDSLIVKRAGFETQTMSGAIMLGFTTGQIKETESKIRRTSLIVSGGIFIVGLLIGLWLARKISVPVRALRDAARLVGQGDLTPNIKIASNDEIGELSKAFNTMVKDISKAREQLNLSNHSLSETNNLLHLTVENLKSTQSQLIQSEKMASLGELTAGIAHEIQNPLNFVNNFSEVNIELLSEMKEAVDQGKMDEVKTIANDVIINEEKINHHGKRADAIVKGMLQHSRASSGTKEPTDINALCEEYLRLAYHGLRAKDKTFNATLKTDFDETIGKINIVPQDIGRALLNLITNAFYAVNDKKHTLTNSTISTNSTNPTNSTNSTNPPSTYEPTISVMTTKTGDSVSISVRDNGPGIPQHVIDKIFQPFFTTKPTGQGTGLGLSLSYDIIKAHGGELKVETKEGEGSDFIIVLPLK